MKKWRVVKEFILGEASTRLRGIKGDEGEFKLAVGTFILQSEVTNEIIIERAIGGDGPDETRRKSIYHFDIGTAFEKFCTLVEVYDESVTGDTIVGIPIPGRDLVWIGPSQLTELVAGKVYRTPDRFVPLSLTVMIRGLMVSKENDDGFDIIDDETFMMKETYTRPKDWMMVGYIKAEVTTV